MVPGPVMSANTLTREKTPLMIPKPRPDTVINNSLVFFINSWNISYHMLEYVYFQQFQCFLRWLFSVPLQLF